MRVKLVASLLLVGTISFFQNATAPQQLDQPHLIGPAAPVPASYFGMHIHRPTPDTWPQVEFSGWRIWDTKGGVWYNLEPRKGQWDFTPLDQYVAMAEQHGVEILLTLGQTPAWASLRPHDGPSWRPGGAAPPKDEQDWKDYVRTVTTRYRGRIRNYEIWNEPNVRDSYTGTPQQLVTLSKDAYEIIHEVSPDAVVASPGIEGDFGVPWLAKYLDLGGGKYADVIAYHFYTDKPPEYAARIIQMVKKTMADRGIDKPIWNTESGYANHSDFQDVQPAKDSGKHVRTSDEFLSSVMREFLLNWASGVNRLYWYDWDGNPMGLGDNNGHQKKPGAYGYSTIRQWMLGAVVKNCGTNSDNDWTCELTRNGRNQWIVWNPDKFVQVDLPARWKVKRLDTLSPTGSSIAIEIGHSRTVTYSPIPSLLY